MNESKLGKEHEGEVKVKKRKIEIETQRKELDKLFKQPDKPIYIPPVRLGAEEEARAKLPAIPEIVTNVQGSSAGAGSGEFHVYKQARRREEMRLNVFELERQREKNLIEFKEKNKLWQNKDDAKTAKNRAKRAKRARGSSNKEDNKKQHQSSSQDDKVNDKQQQQQQFPPTSPSLSSSHSKQENQNQNQTPAVIDTPSPNTNNNNIQIIEEI